MDSDVLAHIGQIPEPECRDVSQVNRTIAYLQNEILIIHRSLIVYTLFGIIFTLYGVYMFKNYLVVVVSIVWLIGIVSKFYLDLRKIKPILNRLITQRVMIE